MSNSIKRTILRFVHLILSIPILGYIYGAPAEVQQYAFATRFVFVPTVVFAGYCMFSGVAFALVGVALWLGVLYFLGYGAVIPTQVALFIVRKIWLVVHARRARVTSPAVP